MRVEFDVVKRLGDFTLAASGSLEGGLTCIVGPNGAGKTTLMKILAGIMRPDRGSVRLFGISSRAYLGEIYVPPDMKALEVVLAGRSRFSPRPAGPRDEKIAMAYMSALGVERLAGREWRALSGGQRQRVALAAALAAEADMLLLDEPLANLHEDWRCEVMKITRDYARGRIVAVSTHHMDVVGLCHHVIVLRDGRIAWRGSAREFRHEERMCPPG
jgi:ABC-type cobalamin/Fe3+-siderophores transport system ATPase subunit